MDPHVGVRSGSIRWVRSSRSRPTIRFSAAPAAKCIWAAYGIEINLQKGGTTHPFLMLQFLTGGTYDPASGLFHTPSGQPRFYAASDNLEAPHYKGLGPSDLVDLAVLNGLHYDGTMHEGVVFHLIGALSEFGKLGLVSVGASPERADALYRRTVDTLDRKQTAD